MAQEPSDVAMSPDQTPVTQDTQPPQGAAPGVPLSPAGQAVQAPIQAPTKAAAAQFDDAFSNPKFLADVAQQYLASGDQNGMQWLQHAHQMARENGVEAAQAMIAGDGDRAVKLWNQRGQYTDAKSATQNSDGKTWTVQREGGQSIQVDPEKVLAGAMNPGAYLQLQRQQALNAAQANYYQQHGDYMKAAAGFQEERAQLGRDKMAQDQENQRIRNEGAANVATIRAYPQMIRNAQASATKQVEEKYGPQAALDSYTKAYQNPNVQLPNGYDGKPLSPPEAAIRDALQTHGGILKPALNPADTDEVIAVDTRTSQGVARIGSRDDFKRITGHDFKQAQQQAAPGAATAKPAVVQPPPPKGASAGMAPQDPVLAAREAAGAANRAKDSAIVGRGLRQVLPSWMRPNDEPNPNLGQ